ncbi:MAG: formylmethanofuran dehydrogenase subunit C [Sedimenticola sp.]|nr:formylmethanofuran dehydrogenase subunit C [Sedimenticola sp.]
MSMILSQTREQRGRIDLRGIIPERLSELDLSAIEQLPITADNQSVPLSEFFSVRGNPSDDLTIVPGNNRLDYIGCLMKTGTITLLGDAGNHAGLEMQGGKLLIKGNSGDYTGSAIQGGEIIVQGDAGDSVGAPGAGMIRGQNGGAIHVKGRAGHRAGECQRRGLLIIEGNVGDLAGYRMIAGTLYIGGSTGIHTGLGMRRGTILLHQHASILPVTMNHSGSLPLTMLSLVNNLLRYYLTDNAPTISPDHHVTRYVGDLACGGMGEIIILQ